MKKSEVGELSLELVRALRPLIRGLERRDRALWQQLVRAVTDVSLSLARAEYPERGARRGHLLAAVFSVSEARAVLHLAVDWGYLAAPRARGAHTLLERTSTMLAQLVRR
jgi:four helix bundle protein